MQRPPDSHQLSGPAQPPPDVAPEPAAIVAYGGHEDAGSDADPHAGTRQDRSFPAIDARTFTDPRDGSRMGHIRVLKGLDFVYSRFVNMGVGQAMALEMGAQAVQIGAGQGASLWQLLDRAARALDIRVPDLYLGHNESGMQTVGHERPFIVVDTGLLDLLTDEELVFAFGRELGHILTGHVTYKMLARSIAAIGNTVGNFTLNVGAMVTTGLEVPLRDWDQFSEFTADRAGLLAVQRLDVATAALFKQAGGGHRFFDEMSLPAFIEQGRRALYEERAVGTRLSAIARSLQAGSPLLAARAAALTEWYESSEYAAVMQGGYWRRAPA
jgi:Zn-dependent protease with chaperone function